MRTSFTIGAVGHRKLAGIEPALQRQISVVLGQLITRHPDERLSMLCSVAEGADRLLLATAVDLGIPFDLVLPCSPECFRQDFHSTDSREEFDRFLHGARTVTQPDGPDDKEPGYLWASETMLERTNTLVAVWDGGPGHGPAGTAETVASALTRGIPVIWIPTEPPSDFQLIEPRAEAVRERSSSGKAYDRFHMMCLREEIENGDIDDPQLAAGQDAQVPGERGWIAGDIGQSLDIPVCEQFRQSAIEPRAWRIDHD